MISPSSALLFCMHAAFSVLGLQHSKSRSRSFWNATVVFPTNVILRSDAPLVCVLESRGAHLVFLFPRESLERTRLKFSLQGGKVTALCLQEGEQVWALNIKRALLSMLQTSHMASKQELEKEVRVDEGSVLPNTCSLQILYKQQLLSLYGDFKLKQLFLLVGQLTSLLLQQTITVINIILPQYRACIHRGII